MPSSLRLRAAAPLTPPRVAAASAVVLAVAAALFRSNDGVPPELRTPLLVTAAVSASFMLLVAPIPQDPSYHAFADRRGYLCGCCGAGGFGGFLPAENEAEGGNDPSLRIGGIDGGRGRRRPGRRRGGLVVPNFFDVASNLIILLGGLAGLAVLALGGGGDGDNVIEGDAWQLGVCLPIFFGGTAAVSVGSVIYHWNPTSRTLVFDRLPMTVAFVAVFVFLLDERILTGGAGDRDDDGAARVGPLILIPLLVLGASSVLYWHITDDLRPYVLVQFGPLLAIPVLLWSYPPQYTGQGHIVSALLWYVVAKVCEERDYEIYNATGRRISGHTLKHATAGFVPFCIAYMLLVREPLPLQQD